MRSWGSLRRPADRRHGFPWSHGPTGRRAERNKVKRGLTSRRIRLLRSSAAALPFGPTRTALARTSPAHWAGSDPIIPSLGRAASLRLAPSPMPRPGGIGAFGPVAVSPRRPGPPLVPSPRSPAGPHAAFGTVTTASTRQHRRIRFHHHALERQHGVFGS